MLLAKAGAQNSAYRINLIKFTTHNGEPRTVIHVSLNVIFTTRIVCSHRDGVLKDCVRLDVSHSLLAWRVGVGGRGLLVLSVGGGVRDRGRWAGMVLGFAARRTALKVAAGALSGCQLAFTTDSTCPA